MKHLTVHRFAFADTANGISKVEGFCEDAGEFFDKFLEKNKSNIDRYINAMYKYYKREGGLEGNKKRKIKKAGTTSGSSSVQEVSPLKSAEIKISSFRAQPKVSSSSKLKPIK